MNHRLTAIYRILERPRVYDRVQELLGARGARKRFVDEILRPFSGASVLDIGCGTGSLLDCLPADVEYVGFDSNRAYIDAAIRRYGDRGRFFCARLGEQPESLAENGFDFVVASALLHHLSDEDAHQLLAAARRYLESGGAFVSTDATRHHGQSFIARILVSLDRGTAVRTPESYRRLVEAHFEDIETWLLTDMLPVPYSHFVIRATTKHRENATGVEQ